MNDDDKRKLIEEIERTVEEQCNRLREIVNTMLKNIVGMIYVAILHLDNKNYEEAKQQLINTIINLENSQEGMEQ
ncbi:MAG: hypothetical protein CL605_03665 [Altibacter sp.]|uniref:hypothetical protein n=1 Tax=Altibacter sp. TaxID=2024823 RepID=UPI000C91D996|nr:hypothetical protein [Altibacter sp.]MAP53978.1 hypothetical protein [Altibacter sp.]|tara:strand:- start:698 stop:922 length:225 start_codon:yes stop_codon:yes gene_type:complete